MKVLLFEIAGRDKKKCINKDLAGGMGTGTWAGNSLRARLFEYVTKKNVIVPAITTAYVSAIFKKAKWQVELINVFSGHMPNLPEADLALLPVSIVDYKQEMEIVRKVKEKGISVGVYGPFVSVLPELFEKEADFVIKGEPESAAMKIVSGKKLPENILEAGMVENLDNLPFPDWNGFPVKKYSYSPVLNKKPVLTMIASRGCPYSCSYYCPYPVGSGKKWRARSVENIIEEIRYLKKEFGVKAIDFRDPIFTLDKSRTRDLAMAMIKNKLNIIWSCETRLDVLDKDLITLMHQAGLKNLNIGIESFSEDVLKNSNRLPVKRDYQEELINFCKKTGVNVAAFYILGLEGEDKANIMNTIRYAKKLNTLIARFGICTPYPGTNFFEDLKKEGRISDFNWENYDEFTPVFEHEFLKKDELLRLKEKAYQSYYFRPAYLLRHMPKYFFQKFLWPF